MADTFVSLKKLITIIILSLFVGFAYSADKNKGGKENQKTCIIKITDNNGEEIAGAKVVLKETGKEYITDFNGNLQIQFTNNEPVTIQIQSIGYSEKTLNSTELSTFNDIQLNSL